MTTPISRKLAVEFTAAQVRSMYSVLWSVLNDPDNTAHYGGHAMRALSGAYRALEKVMDEADAIVEHNRQAAKRRVVWGQAYL